MVAGGGGKDDRKQNTLAPLITCDPTNQRFFLLALDYIVLKGCEQTTDRKQENNRIERGISLV